MLGFFYFNSDPPSWPSLWLNEVCSPPFFLKPCVGHICTAFSRVRLCVFLLGEYANKLHSLDLWIDKRNDDLFWFNMFASECLLPFFDCFCRCGFREQHQANQRLSRRHRRKRWDLCCPRASQCDAAVAFYGFKWCRLFSYFLNKGTLHSCFSVPPKPHFFAGGMQQQSWKDAYCIFAPYFH